MEDEVVRRNGKVLRVTEELAAFTQHTGRVQMVAKQEGL